MKTNLKIFFSTIDDGNMNQNPEFYKEGMTESQISRNFYIRRLFLGRQLGFNGTKILVPSQKKFPNIENETPERQAELLQEYYDKYKYGKYIKVTERLMKGYEDLYDLDLPADILLIDKSLPGIALAYPVADSPVVFAEDMKKQVVAMAQCGIEYIDRELPGQLIDALRKSVGSKVQDIRVIVGPHAKEANFTYDCIPKSIVREENWQDCLRKDKKGLIHINMSKAIINQLVNKKIDLQNIYVSKIDTITDTRFYSHHRAVLNSEPEGRFYTGCVYLDEEPKQKVR